MKNKIEQKNYAARFVFFLIILFILNVVVSQATLLLNIKQAGLEQESQSLREENSKIRVELSKKQSIDIITRKAKALGFTESARIIYLTGQQSLAKND